MGNRKDSYDTAMMFKSPSMDYNTTDSTSTSDLVLDGSKGLLDELLGRKNTIPNPKRKPKKKTIKRRVISPKKKSIKTYSISTSNDRK